jgi:SAM-dependent methyltransferase
VFTANLALLDRLDALGAAEMLPGDGTGPLRALDVGSGDFHYATALQRFLSRHGDGPARAVELLGCEVDGHGIYRDGHSRADHARAHAALAAEAQGSVQYVVGDAARLRLPPQDVVTLFFPFLSIYPLLQWGLPLSRWRPRRLLRRVVMALRPGGWLVVSNQTAAEFDRLRSLLVGQPVELVRQVTFASDLVPRAERTADRTGSLWRRLELQPGGASG